MKKFYSQTLNSITTIKIQAKIQVIGNFNWNKKKMESVGVIRSSGP